MEMEPLTIVIKNSSTKSICGISLFTPGSRKCKFTQRNNHLPVKPHNRGFETIIRAFARRSNAKKLKRIGEKRNQTIGSESSDEYNNAVADKSAIQQDDFTLDSNRVVSSNDTFATTPRASPSRSDVLQACTVTSGLILALALVIRQASHFAFMGGWPVHDCSTEVLFDFEMWHLGLILGLVILVSSCRYLLLRTWPDFAESSEAANQQVLSSLQPLDYIVVAFLPGISEELLFRGALLPLFGLNWKSALVVATIFGLLHLGSGRRSSFAVWATFVGLAYGYATIASSTVIVPMTSHALNNLLGGVMWRYMPTASQKKV